MHRIWALMAVSAAAVCAFVAACSCQGDVAPERDPAGGQSPPAEAQPDDAPVGGAGVAGRREVTIRVIRSLPRPMDWECSSGPWRVVGSGEPKFNSMDHADDIPPRVIREDMLALDADPACPSVRVYLMWEGNPGEDLEVPGFMRGVEAVEDIAAGMGPGKPVLIDLVIRRPPSRPVRDYGP